MDLIERKGAIDALYKMLHDCFGADDEELDAVITTLSDLSSAHPEPQWTSCAKRLPEANGNYLVTGRQGAVNKRKFEDGRWYGNWAVTAWMPLPAPYKEDAE